MNRREETQYAASGIGVVEGAEMDFRQPPEGPCQDCGKLVNLTSEVTFTVENKDDSETPRQMTEANARVLIMMMGIAPPPIQCGRHEVL